VFFLPPLDAKAQSEEESSQLPNIEASGYVEAFYMFDFNQPQTDYRQSFYYNYNRHNEINLNLGFLKFSVQQPNYRSSLALQTGTYPNDNYVNEPGLLKTIFEANAGISLNKKGNLWVDGGVFASHIGFESAISFDNWTLSRSILAENSPYYLSGAKLSFAPHEKIEINTLICNGWQRIQKVNGNSLPSFGTQMKWMPNKEYTLNWSTFIGTDDPDSLRRMRYFSNLYAQLKLSKKIGLILGFDLGTQQQNKNSTSYYFWFSPIVIAQIALNPNWKCTVRTEYYQDKKGIIVSSANNKDFETFGCSLNFDYSPTPNVICRIEGRWLSSRNPIFETKSIHSNTDFCLGTSISIRFSDKINN